MKKHRELGYEELIKNVCNPEELKFETTDELVKLDGVIGEERAKKALKYGMEIDMKGYNMYIAGPSGSGKTSYARTYINHIASKKDVPKDWCYVYNFENSQVPTSICFPTGKGIVFKQDMEEFIDDLVDELNKAFSEEEYESQRSKVMTKHEEEKDAVMQDITDRAKKMGFAVKTSNTGLYFMPLIDGEALNEDQYQALSDKEKEEISAKSQKIQKEAMDIMAKIKKIDKKVKKKLEKLDYEIGLFAVGHHITAMKEKYKEYDKVCDYLELLKEDILDNIKDIVDEEDDQEVQGKPIWMKSKKDEIINRYKVNLLVNNKKTKGAPVVVDFNPTYYKLIGQAEYDNEFGNLRTDFTKIQKGLLHKANGGYLILQVSDLLKNPNSWTALKRAIKTKEISIENLRDQYGMVPVSSLKPESIPLDIKVILVGDNHLYHILYENDDDFKKLFKIKVDFDNEAKKNYRNIHQMAKFIKGFCEREKVPPFNKYAVSEIIQYSSRIIGSQIKMTTKLNEIAEILCEASVWAKLDKSDIIKQKHVKQAIAQKEYRSNLYEEKMDQMIDEQTIMLDIKGSKIGQINGLAVLDTGEHTFGKPTRITATTYMGRAGIVNIEKEANMSGKIHNKGIQVISGFLGQKFAQDMPLSLSARISFEQNYSGIDGDSASSTELYALLSSLAELPISQEIAVTGSINQWGEIQPIGGVTYKVEGFYNLCKARKLTGKQGVIIPYQNVNDLVLKEEVLEAIKKGEFHIYPIKNIDEGIEILTNVPAGKKGANGKYSKNSVYGKVVEKISGFNKSFAKILK